ncbi:MAG: hypothetical protein ACK4GQ_03980 [Candidatus Hadarchaeales archaeon]
MSKVLIVWDVKKRGSPATKFYRALFGYGYKTREGPCHAPGILDALPSDVWECVNRSTLLIEEEFASAVEEIFKEFDEILKWFRFRVEEE